MKTDIKYIRACIAAVPIQLLISLIVMYIFIKIYVAAKEKNA